MLVTLHWSVSAIYTVRVQLNSRSRAAREPLVSGSRECASRSRASQLLLLLLLRTHTNIGALEKLYYEVRIVRSISSVSELEFHESLPAFHGHAGNISVNYSVYGYVESNDRH